MSRTQFRVEPKQAGVRLDQFLAGRLKDTSRAQVQAWIKAGSVRVDGSTARPSLRLRGGERIEVARAEPAAPAGAFAEAIPLEILHEDDDLVAIHKPAGMTVHVGAGRRAGTLVNALLHHFGRLSAVGGPQRPGIVHRLDRLTSGVLLVAKTDAAHRALAAQFARREVGKTYVALVHARKAPTGGRPIVIDGATWRRLEMPIRRDRRQRVKMTTRAREGRAAVTDYRVTEQWKGFALVEARIATGRTHQIRVHLAAIGHPVVGDTLYGAPAQPTLSRVFLHAQEISFTHPSSGERLAIRASLPQQLRQRLDELRGQGSTLVLL